MHDNTALDYELAYATSVNRVNTQGLGGLGFTLAN